MNQNPDLSDENGKTERKKEVNCVGDLYHQIQFTHISIIKNKLWQKHQACDWQKPQQLTT